ncbi:MAG: putative 50S ribosomal protein L1p [Candidatus Berkelbacteria bacterium Licking1014_85]|uniref:Ribosomal protein n=1 Tax=Candidatus Berkelbacteria bacterium Licking1014_85 TaxID=2017148 RepID=A0A554LIW9_9BACT|nr:MAG: putative 50S ribosomal protein L1p [Candidatus Berkelbacteria bacterium Licking1014_85]
MGQQKATIIGTTVEDIIDPQIKDKPARQSKLGVAGGKAKSKDINVIPSEVEGSLKSVPDKSSTTKTRGKKRIRAKRSKKYLANRKILSEIKSKDLASIANRIKEIAGKTVQTINLSINISAKKGQDAIRKMVSLPSGATKQPKIAIADDNILQELEKGKIDFEILIATPEYMPKLAKYAKILGPKGLMPNPKSGTVSDKPEEAKKALLSGNVELKTDKTNIIHIPVGKTDWETDKITANINAVLKEIPDNRLTRAFLSGSQSPSVKL